MSDEAVMGLGGPSQLGSPEEGGQRLSGRQAQAAGGLVPEDQGAGMWGLAGHGDGSAVTLCLWQVS